jgi:predicted ATP-grasp superfamily ATP-dependent carboligase
MLAEKAFLIAALTGRALAQSASRARLSVVVLDLYNDVDTRCCALRSRAVVAHNESFDAKALLKAAQELCPPQVCDGLIEGSGFEDRPELLHQLAQGRRLYGNTPGTVARLKDPARFFPLLDRLAIPHPEVSLQLPRKARGWLSKKTGGNGGGHVLLAAGTVADAQHYYQRLEAGRIMSVTFLANGKEAYIIGFNEQWTACAGSPFRYAGAINHAELPQALRTEIAGKLNLLTEETQLVGLNGMDFLLSGDHFSVLEINPRPSATMDLYDADYAQGLFAWHVQACQGNLPPPRMTRNIVRAHAVVFAEQAFSIPANLKFPGWASDIPQSGSEFAAGAPVCMVHAEGESALQVKHLLQERKTLLARTLREEAA